VATTRAGDLVQSFHAAKAESLLPDHQTVLVITELCDGTVYPTLIKPAYPMLRVASALDQPQENMTSACAPCRIHSGYPFADVEFVHNMSHTPQSAFLQSPSAHDRRSDSCARRHIAAVVVGITICFRRFGSDQATRSTLPISFHVAVARLAARHAIQVCGLILRINRA
jgi:hypothetical protein